MTRALPFIISAFLSAAQAGNLYMCDDNGRKMLRSEPCKKAEVERGRHNMDRYAAIGVAPVPSNFAGTECRQYDRRYVLDNLADVALDEARVDCWRALYNRAVMAQNASITERAGQALRKAEADRATRDQARARQAAAKPDALDKVVADAKRERESQERLDALRREMYGSQAPSLTQNKKSRPKVIRY